MATKYKFKIGDVVKIIDDVKECKESIGKITHIVSVDESGYESYPYKLSFDTCRCEGMFGEDELELVEEDKPTFKKGDRGKMSSLSTLAKKLLDPKTKTLVKAGLLDSELELTEVGIDVLQNVLFLTYKEEMVVEARRLLKEQKKQEEEEE